MKRRLLTVTDGAPVAPLAVLFGLNAVDELDQAAFGVLLPEIREHFGLSLTGMLSVLGLVGLAALALQIPIAIYADRGNRVRMAWIGALGWGFFSVFTGLAPSLLLLSLARVGSGLGKAVVGPTHNSLLSDYYPLHARAGVFSVHSAANPVGLCLGPLLAGLLAAEFGWRAPFFVFALPTFVLVLAARRLREPIRGHFERAAAGASAELSAIEESRPSFAEAWRTVWRIGTLRRIWYAMPFLAAAFVGFGSLASLMYDQVFGLDERARGMAGAAAAPGVLVGLYIGARIATRLQNEAPSAAMRFVAHQAVVVSALLALFALAPNVPLAVVAHALIGAALAVLLPGTLSSLSFVIPPRARSMGFAVTSLWVVPGLLILPVIGVLGDHVGFRAGMMALLPMFLIGGLVLSTVSRTIDADIDDVWRAAATRAELAEEHARGRSPLLMVRGLEVAYGKVRVLNGIDLDIEAGSCVALLGTNGAGKSTLLKAICGVVEADAGVVLLGGREISHAPANEIAAMGVAQLPGGHGTFPTLTVAENLEAAAWLVRHDTARAAAEVTRVFDLFPMLAERQSSPAGDLSGGQQQMLALGMSLITKPRLLLIDELSLGLSPAIVTQLLQLVEELRAAGTTVVLVEQSVNVALQAASQAYFMEKGTIRFQGPTAELLDRPDLLRSVFLEGKEDHRTDERPSRPARQARGETVLEARDLTCAFGGVRAVDGVSISLSDGEIVGVIGPNGAGKTTLFDLLSGHVPVTSGDIRIAGASVARLGPAGRARAGLGRSFQDARLFSSLTVEETLAVACERHVRVKDPLRPAFHLPSAVESEHAVSERVRDLVDSFNLQDFRTSFMRELSTGTRRMVDLACLLAHEPSIILLDEPSSGMAQREVEALAPLLLRARSLSGASLLVVEHDISLVSHISDRLVAMDQGRVIAEGPPAIVLNDPTVVSAYIGDDSAAVRRTGLAVI